MLKKINFNKSHEIVTIDFPFHIIHNNDSTNGAYRIAHFLSIVSGDNFIKSIELYSDHIKKYASDGVRIESALGPRIKYWVGAHGVAEAIKEAEEINELDTGGDNFLSAKEYCKSSGIDQLHKTYLDIHNGMSETTIVCRDPDLDFDNNKYIPDLISITFSRHQELLTVFANFGEASETTEFINDLWFLSRLCELYKLWLSDIGIKKVELKILCNCVKSSFSVDVFQSKELFELVDSDPDIFWEQISTLVSCLKHLRAFLNKENLMKDDISPEYLVKDKLIRLFVGQWQKDEIEKYVKINMPYVLDMFLSLIIYPLSISKYSERFEDLVIELYQRMTTDIKYEIIPTIINNSNFSASNLDMFSVGLQVRVNS